LSLEKQVPGPPPITDSPTDAADEDIKTQAEQ
jgi:hypothetical protein